MPYARVFGCVLAFLLFGPGSGAWARQPAEIEALNRSYELLSPNVVTRSATIRWFKARGKKDALPILIELYRFVEGQREEVLDAITALAGEKIGSDWHEMMLWQEAHPEVKPLPGYASFKAVMMINIDPSFMMFIHPAVKHEIRLEEIAWGGVGKDGIPSLDNPKLIEAAEAQYMNASDLVFGVVINGDARAYPLRILDWHEMFNDVIGGVPVSLAYCTLCGSGILYEGQVEGRVKPFVFGSSGFLYRSNKLMYDQETKSLWNQFTGRPVVGELTGSGITLKTRPVVITSWEEWKKREPKTKVLSLETGFKRDYSPGAAYARYFESDKLMFPTRVDEKTFKAKSYVFALRGQGHEKAWPLAYFEKSPVINDSVGETRVVLVGDAKTRSVRAYKTTGETFAVGETSDKLKAGADVWTITEDALVGPKGEKLPRLPGHIAYWFAWSGYFGDKGEIAKPPG
jgi:hypothetical protein